MKTVASRLYIPRLLIAVSATRAAYRFGSPVYVQYVSNEITCFPLEELVQLKQSSINTKIAILKSLSPTKRTPLDIQLYLRSRMGLWGKYYYAPFHITHNFFF